MIHKVFIYFDEKYMQVAKLTYLLPISFYSEHYFTLELFFNQNDKSLINSNETRKAPAMSNYSTQRVYL